MCNCAGIKIRRKSLGPGASSPYQPRGHDTCRVQFTTNAHDDSRAPSLPLFSPKTRLMPNKQSDFHAKTKNFFRLQLQPNIFTRKWLVDWISYLRFHWNVAFTRVCMRSAIVDGGSGRHWSINYAVPVCAVCIAARQITRKFGIRISIIYSTNNEFLCGVFNPTSSPLNPPPLPPPPPARFFWGARAEDEV